MDKEPDYETYSLSDLEYVLNHIDKEAYPDRVEKVLIEIERRKIDLRAKESSAINDDPEVFDSSQEKNAPDQKKDGVTGSNAEIAIFTVCTAFFAIWAWFGLDDAIVGGRRGREYSLEGEPVMYLFITGVRVLCFFMGAFYLSKSINKKIKNKEQT